MRGARALLLFCLCSRGIIPAYAGSTSTVNHLNFRKGDHPRVCGEHTATGTAETESGGSSPRMRGARRIAHLMTWRSGIIPAYAGSTTVSSSSGSESRDHPRVCGEHRCKPSCAWRSLGSSPRMRGAPRSRERRAAFCGIIPAYAGSTSSTWRPTKPRRDHPRVCGEHRLFNRRYAVELGSSPRMRGAPQLRKGPLRVRGIIPAYAGSTMADYYPHCLI